MDPHDEHETHDSKNQKHNDSGDDDDSHKRPHELPLDLPRSLDDRRGYQQEYGLRDETEIYDAWQGRLRIGRRYPEILVRLMRHKAHRNS